MSRRGNYWDAAIEAFFGRLKVELIYAENCDSIERAKSGIFEYIEIFYNRRRRHSHLGQLSPADYEKKLISTRLMSIYENRGSQLTL